MTQLSVARNVLVEDGAEIVRRNAPRSERNRSKCGVQEVVRILYGLGGRRKGELCYIGLAMIGFKERRWKITLYKRELQSDGRVADVEIESFEEARPKQPSGDIHDSHGRLCFLTTSGKEVLTGGIAFIAREL